MGEEEKGEEWRVGEREGADRRGMGEEEKGEEWRVGEREGR